jgi:hypothetical protein
MEMKRIQRINLKKGLVFWKTKEDLPLLGKLTDREKLIKLQTKGWY